MSFDLEFISRNGKPSPTVMDVWESMYDSLTPDFKMSQIEGQGLGLDGFVDVNL
jgi:hypothetical protein